MDDDLFCECSEILFEDENGEAIFQPLDLGNAGDETGTEDEWEDAQSTWGDTGEDTCSDDKSPANLGLLDGQGPLDSGMEGAVGGAAMMTDLNKTCAVCCEEMTKETPTGSPDGCEHKFCLPCIQKWASDYSNTCPVDGHRFNVILVHKPGEDDYLCCNDVQQRNGSGITSAISAWGDFEDREAIPVSSDWVDDSGLLTVILSPGERGIPPINWSDVLGDNLPEHLRRREIRSKNSQRRKNQRDWLNRRPGRRNSEVRSPSVSGPSPIFDLATGIQNPRGGARAKTRDRQGGLFQLSTEGRDRNASHTGARADERMSRENVESSGL